MWVMSVTTCAQNFEELIVLQYIHVATEELLAKFIVQELLLVLLLWITTIKLASSAKDISKVGRMVTMMMTVVADSFGSYGDIDSFKKFKSTSNFIMNFNLMYCMHPRNYMHLDIPQTLHLSLGQASRFLLRWVCGSCLRIHADSGFPGRYVFFAWWFVFRRCLVYIMMSNATHSNASPLGVT